MKKLKRVALVQFYLHEAFDIDTEGATAFLGPNGSGKSSTLDAIQIAMLGGNQTYSRYNTQSVSSKQSRTLAGYCLGLLRNPENDSDVIGRARDEARTYIVLVFSDGSPEGVMSAGICVEADIESDKHDVKGLFILPGQNITASDCVVAEGELRRPMPFSDFQEMCRNRGKGIGRTPIFTNASGEYVSELLYALNGERMPNAKRFMSAFVKSMTLKNVDSIDQFVRDYVVYPKPVDIASFRKQVKQFVSLKELIQKTKARISRLTGILTHFEKALSIERKIASLNAIMSIFNVESLLEKIDQKEEDITTQREQLRTATEEAKLAKNKRDEKRIEVTSLQVKLESDEDEQIRLRLEEVIHSRQEIITAYQSPEISRANRILSALRDICEEKCMATCRDKIQFSIAGILEARNSQNSGEEIIASLKKLAPDLEDICKTAIEQRKLLVREKTALDDEYQAVRNRISAASRTGRLLGDGSALLLDILGKYSIQAQPISALAKISNPEWAPALESYLGNDRDALVITEGESQHAVKLLREARKQGLRIDGAAIVQPYHLRNVDTSERAGSFVVGILDATNETARKFLWAKFGKMRLVDSESELEQHARAITVDGMLSQGGLTKSIKVLPASDLRLGKSFTDTSYLSEQVALIRGQLDLLNKRINKLEFLINMLSIQYNDNADQMDKLSEANRDIELATQQLHALDVSHLEKIRESLNKAESELAALDKTYSEYDRVAGGLENQIATFETEKQRLERELPNAREKEEQAVKADFVDLQLVDELKDEIERSESEYFHRIAVAEKKIQSFSARITRAIDNGSSELFRYADEERLDVQLPDMEWHDRVNWTRDEKQKLTDTQLHNYETEAEQARLAAEETLRSDIAMSLYDRFKEMELERRERNKILESCPAFTGGERYRFVSSVVPHYETLVRYVNQIATSEQNLSLFDTNAEEVNETLRELVDAAAESGNAGEVLDYRQFFTFDLDILVDGKRVDRMSSRQGAGSNGEHIAPMYVAAGAALAKAYRLYNRKGQTSGAGLICLDEAFHGMDTVNAIATARFLQSIGLQLIMAAPETERTKLAPITQTIYDLDREGLDLMMEKTLFKEPANKLMVSDMPEENPQVMLDAYEKLGLEPPTNKNERSDETVST